MGLLGSVRALRLSIVFIDANNTEKLQIYHHSTGIYFALLYVKFEDELSISVLKNRATPHKNLQRKVEKFLKKSIVCKAARPFYFPPRLSNLAACMPGFSR